MPFLNVYLKHNKCHSKKLEVRDLCPLYVNNKASLVARKIKKPPANVGDLGSIPALGRSPGEGDGYPLWYSCLENPMDKGAWRATIHGVADSQTKLSH